MSEHLPPFGGHTRRRVAVAMACGSILAMLCACAGAPPVIETPKPRDVVLTVVAATDLNPDRNGRPSPLYLHVFQLREAGKFLAAEFDEVTTRADQSLAGAIVSRESLMVQPGRTVPVALKVDPESRVVGVVAEYSDLASTRWRTAMSGPDSGLADLLLEGRMTLLVERGGVTFSAGGDPGK